MKRRDFLIGSIGSFLLQSSVSVAKPQPTTHAAVIIGVNKSGNLKTLKAAVSGATQVHDWLLSQKYNSVLITDEQGMVRAQAIKDAVRSFIGGSYKQLVIYFAGHGFSKDRTEFWLLSEAPMDPDQAINLEESAYLARRSGITNVIFISDACRSNPFGTGQAQLSGSTIFPDPDTAPPVHVYVDQFLATGLGKEAYEARAMADDYDGLFTSVLVAAFRDPPSDITGVIDQDEVVLNRKLGPYLRSEVAKKAGQRNKNQVPDDILQCEPEAFIAPVRRSQAAQANEVAPPVGPGDFSKGILRESLGGEIIVAPTQLNNLPAAIQKFGRDSGFETRLESVLAIEPNVPHQEESRPGGGSYSISGAGVLRAIASPGLTMSVSETQPGADHVTLQVDFQDAQIGSIAIQFTDGSGTVLAAIRDFNAEVLVSSIGVANVSFTFTSSDFDEERLRGLRAMVAAAASVGAFRLNSSAEAERFGDRIRVDKAIDPTLGLYAAYAYLQAGLTDKLRSVAEVMEFNLSAYLFDVALLDEQIDQSEIQSATLRSHRGTLVVPFCPMLTQGWNYIRAMKIRYPEEIERARQNLRPSLWTTFEPEAMEMVLASDIWSRRE